MVVPGLPLALLVRRFMPKTLRWVPPELSPYIVSTGTRPVLWATPLRNTCMAKGRWTNSTRILWNSSATL